MIIICCVMLSCSDSSVQDMGTVILGKLESGSISKAQQLVMMPNRVRIKCNQQNSSLVRCSRIFTVSTDNIYKLLQHTVEVLNLLSDDVETDDAGPGENLKLRLKGIEEEEILPGFILCSPDNLCHSGRTFDAQVRTRACKDMNPLRITASW